MNLIQEYSIKVIIFTFCLAFALEAAIVIFLFLTSKSTLNQTYDETIQRSENKAIEFTKSVKSFISFSLMKYITDLKLIARNTYIYNSKDNTSNTNLFNMNSKVISNNERYKIIAENQKELINKTFFNKIYNNSTDKLDYFNYYSNLFGNETNNNLILNKILREHEELNYINYINYTNFSNIENLSDEEKKKLKFILAMLKSIYIKEFIAKKSSMNLLNLLIFSENELIIYPPNDPYKIYLYNYYHTYFQLRNQLVYPIYPICIYDTSINSYQVNLTKYILTINEYINYDKAYASFCIKFPYIKEKPDKSLVCTEIDVSSVMSSLNFKNSQYFEFGMYKIVNLNDLRDIMILYYNTGNISIDEIKNTFNDSKTTPGKYLIGKDSVDNITSQYLRLYHILYFNTTKIIREHPELNINLNEIENEYNYLFDKLFNSDLLDKNDENANLTIPFERTVCQKVIIGDEFECIKDQAEIIISPLIIKYHLLDDTFLEKDETIVENLNDLFIFSIVSTNPKLNKDKINSILNSKIERIIIFYFFITVIIFCFFILFINIISEYSFKSVNILIESINKINIDEEKREINFLEEDKSFTANNEMLNLKGFYEAMRKSLIIKQAFTNELYLKKNSLDFYNLIQDLKIKNIKEICNSFMAYFHFNNKIYNISENEFQSTINFIQENENKLKSEGINELDDRLKDAIKRSSTVSYLNEYSKFENLDENMVDIIYLKIFKQRFIYLYAMTKFKLGSEISSGNSNEAQNNIGAGNKNKAKKNKEKVINYFKDAIKYFQECKNINSSLGINQIKIIYSLIMISKCYLQLNDYKNSIESINEALSLYFEFSQTFKEYHSKNYNPKVMLFVESNIFHYILFTFSRICVTFNKPCASNWIILKIFETSPFLFSNIHFHAGLSLHNFFEKNKTKMNKYDQNFYKKAKTLKEFDKIKKYYAKIVSRIYNKNSSKVNKRTNTENIGESLYTSSNRSPTVTESVADKSRYSSNFKKDMATSRVSSAFHAKNKKLYKNVTFCMSEKILEKVNGQEFKDVLIKYIQKYFVINDNDKFSFVQFSDNGKKTVFLKPELLNNFLLKFQKTKGTFEVTESFSTSITSTLFIELYNILDSIIKSYTQPEESDNIILIFMDTEDIRFSSVDDCLNIVEDLNKKNVSVYFFTYDENIKEEKVNNIQSFLNGLIEGNFYCIKNYQQIKQIFINISTIKNQSNFFSFDYDIFETAL